MRVVSYYGSNIPLKVLYSSKHEYFPKHELSWFFNVKFYVVLDMATRGSIELLSEFLGKYFRFLYKQKL